MKKFFALILALCLLCGASAMATEYGPASSNPETTLTTTLEETYTVVIPSTLNISFEATSTNLPIEVTALRLYPNGTIENTDRAVWVHLEQPGFELVNDKDASSKISYDIGGGEGTLERDHYFTEAGTKNYAVSISESAWNNAAAGTYTDTVTFTVNITNINKN